MSRKLQWCTSAFACAVLLGATAACSGGGGDNSGSTQLVYRLWDEKQAKRYKQMVKVFEEQHPKIDVKVEQLPWSAYWKKITTEAAAGTAPDVFKVLPSRFAEYVRKGILMDLSETIKQQNIDVSQYRDVVRKPYEYKGHLYGLPVDQGVQVVYYNKEIFKKTGIQMPDELTWNPQGTGTLLPLARKLTVDKKGNHPDDPGFDAKHVKHWGFVSWNHAGSQWFNWIRGGGGKLVNHPYGKWTFDQPKAVQALTWATDLIDKWNVSPPATMTNPPDGHTTEMFQRGQIAMFNGSNALVSFIAPESNFDIGVAAMPKGPAGRFSSSHGGGEVVFAGTEHPEAAQKLVAFLASAKARRVAAKNGGSIPALKNQKLAKLYVKYWKAQGVDMQPAIEQQRNGAAFAVPVVAHYDAAMGEIKPVFNQMYLGQLTPKEAAAKAVSAANEAVQGG